MSNQFDCSAMVMEIRKRGGMLMQEVSVCSQETGYAPPHGRMKNFARHGVRKIVSYSCEGKRFLTLTLDLGLDGFTIQTEHPFPKDEHVEFQLVLGHKSIYLKGLVVFSRSLSRRQMVSDIQFMDLSKNDQKLLKDYLCTMDL
jgi:hypothetical protein